MQQRSIFQTGKATIIQQDMVKSVGGPCIKCVYGNQVGSPAACGSVAARALRAAGQQVCSLGNNLAMMEREGAGKRRGV